MTAPAENLHGAQSFGIELLLTFVLVLSIFGATDRGKNHHGYEIPLSIGLCVFICHMVGVSTAANKYQPRDLLSFRVKKASQFILEASQL